MVRNTRVNRQKTKRKTRSRRGGGVIGSGSYGCVYRPALRCSGNAAVNRSKQISKLVKTTNVAGEIKGVDLLKAIDPGQEYLLYPLDEMCPFNINEQPDRADVESSFLAPGNVYNYLPEPVKDTKCRIKEIQSNSTVLFNYDGGSPPTETIYSANDYYAVFEGFRNIFDAVKKLHDNDVVHHDIKDINMVLKQNESGSGFDYRLIDFGFIQKLDDFRRQFNNGPLVNRAYMVAYAPWPFYTFIYAYNRNEILNTLQSKQNQVRYDFKESIQRKIQRWEQVIKRDIGKIPEGLLYKSVGYATDRTPIFSPLENIKNNIMNIIASEKNYITFAKNIDIFGISYSLIKIFSHMFGIHLYLSNTVMNESNIYIKFNNSHMININKYNWKDPKLKEWFFNFSKDLISPFMHVFAAIYSQHDLWKPINLDTIKSTYNDFLYALEGFLYIPGTKEKRREFVKYLNIVKPGGFSPGDSTPFVPTPVASTIFRPSQSTGMSLAVPLPPPAPQPVRPIHVTGRGVKRQATPTPTSTVIGSPTPTTKSKFDHLHAIASSLSSASTKSSTSIKAASQATTPSNTGFFPGNL
jgi:serine/threonine protein kinase